MDPNRALQHSFCYDLIRSWSVSVSWGYTVQLYPFLVTSKKLETAYLTFRTWRSWSDDPFHFNTQAMSPDPCERPLIYFFDRIERVERNKTLTTYTRFIDENENAKACARLDYAQALTVESFSISAATLTTDVWKMVRTIFLISQIMLNKFLFIA